MPMLLKRNQSNGAIFNQLPGQPATPVVLRGGHCHLFGVDTGLRFWGIPTGPIAIQEFRTTFPPEDNGCAGMHDSPTLRLVTWEGGYGLVLDKLVENGCNFLRVFLSDGVFLFNGAITSLHPYERANFKWRIAAATRGDQTAWSAAYFNRLRDFVKAADDRGVVVQLCLFTHHDFRGGQEGPGHAYWERSFWNPANADDGTNLVTIATGYLDRGLEPGPALEEEIEEGQKAALRNQDFMNTARAGLMAVQRAFVHKVLETVCPRDNVILELMNEPRLLNDGTNPLGMEPGAYQARWLNTATGWILAWLAARPITWRPLISANAAPPRPGLAYDVDSWRLLAAPNHYTQLDAISYHGLTGYPAAANPTPGAYCGLQQLPAVDTASIQRRVTEHRGKHNAKSLICSTDAVRDFPQRYPVEGQVEKELLLRRDGQVLTSLGYEEQAPTVHAERARADLDNWAYDVLRHGFGRVGTDPREASVHFQNHATTEPSFRRIGQAAAAARAGSGTGTGTGQWGASFVRTAGGAGNFWWAHRLNPTAREIVNQLGTHQAQEVAGAQGVSAIGWRYDLAPVTTSRIGCEADYQVVSVSEGEQGAQVTPRVAVTLYAVDAAGGLGAQLLRTERVLASGAGPGTLTLSAEVTAGGRYAAVVTGEVAITYANRAQGNGETILRFPGMRIVGAP